MKEKVFIDSDTKLNDIVSFSQYIIGDRKLITIMGESHGYTKQCPGENINVEDYCLECVKMNNNCYILCEFSFNSLPPKHIFLLVNEVLKKITKDRIIPIDVRSIFLGLKNFNNFGNQSLKLWSSAKKCKKLYLDTYYDNLHHFRIDKSKYGKEEYKCLKTYNRSLCAEAKEISSLLGKINISQNLLYFWSNIMDFFILKYILSDDDTDYILLAGDNHRINLESILDKTQFATCINKQTIRNGEEIDENNCVSLYNSMLIR